MLLDRERWERNRGGGNRKVKEGFSFQLDKTLALSKGNDPNWVVLEDNKEQLQSKSAVNTTDKTLRFTFLIDEEHEKNWWGTVKKLFLNGVIFL